jgi:hypothetical protein
MNNFVPNLTKYVLSSLLGDFSLETSEASFLNEFSRLQKISRLRSIAPTLKFAPTHVLKNWPQVTLISTEALLLKSSV